MNYINICRWRVINIFGYINSYSPVCPDKKSCLLIYVAMYCRSMYCVYVCSVQCDAFSTNANSANICDALIGTLEFVVFRWYTFKCVEYRQNVCGICFVMVLNIYITMLTHYTMILLLNVYKYWRLPWKLWAFFFRIAIQMKSFVAFDFLLCWEIIRGSYCIQAVMRFTVYSIFCDC